MAMRYGYTDSKTKIPQWAIILNLAEQYHVLPWIMAPERSMSYWLHKRGVYQDIKQRVQEDTEDEAKRNR